MWVCCSLGQGWPGTWKRPRYSMSLLPQFSLRNVIGRLLYIIFQRSWQPWHLMTGRRQTSHPPWGNARRRIQGTTVQWVYPQSPERLWTISLWKTCPHMKEKKVTGNSQHRFFMGKSCLINLIAVSDKMTGYHSLLFSTGAYLECCPGFWLPSSWKTSTYWNEVSGGPPSRLGDRITWPTGKSWEKRICSAVKKEG